MTVGGGGGNKLTCRAKRANSSIVENVNFFGFPKRCVRVLARKIRSVFRMAKYRLLPSNFLSPIENFRKDGWNRILWDSVPTSPPLEIAVFGGFLGNSVEDWLRRVPDSRVNVFEPVPVFAERLEHRFSEQDVVVHAFGVGSIGGHREFKLLSDSTFLSSLNRSVVGAKEENTQNVLFRRASDAALLLPEKIGVMEVNIEGGEYELISALGDINVLSRITHIFVQFHDVGKDTESLVEDARRQLARTHVQVWNYEMVWEYWRLSGAK